MSVELAEALGHEVLPTGPAVEAELPEGWLTQRAERDLLRRAQSGSRAERERAFERLLRAYTPMLDAAVWRMRGFGADRADLEQVARLAFGRAVAGFDLTREWRLSSYAKPWLEGALRREAASGALIKLPREKARLVRQIEVRGSELAKAFGREPTRGELAADLDVSPEQLDEAQQLPRWAWSLARIADGETGALVEGDERRWKSRSASMADADDEVSELDYSAAEAGVLVEEYQLLRSALEVGSSGLVEQRLRRRARVSDLCRLADLDRALQRIEGRLWLIVELTGLHDLSLRALERLLRVPHSTLQYRRRLAVNALAPLLNGDWREADTRRHIFWRRLFAWDIGSSAWTHDEEPISFLVWARIGQAGALTMPGRQPIPVKALAGFGEGWLITPELMDRSGRDNDGRWNNVVEVAPKTSAIPAELIEAVAEIWAEWQAGATSSDRVPAVQERPG